ncbi:MULTISPECIES: hypothetical protein [unclassified Pseudoclavibacter]|uniref:hypothetical protein n=1 Tax=unclassified Pseudoclavibacter TaxID=2615177 RepID=UPI001E33CCC4|nr:hypothetical protein [Pseudoclavibacter sp. 13-3]
MGPTLIHTGVHVALPDDVSAIVSLYPEQRARGLHLDGASTFLPPGFTGEITLLLITAGPRVVPVKSGQPLARLTPVRVVALHPVRVLAPAARGLGGRLEGV